MVPCSIPTESSTAGEERAAPSFNARWQTNPKPIPTAAPHPRPHIPKSGLGSADTQHQGKHSPAPGALPAAGPRHIPGAPPKTAPGCSGCPCAELLPSQPWKSPSSRDIQANVPARAAAWVHIQSRGKAARGGVRAGWV